MTGVNKDPGPLTNSQSHSSRSLAVDVSNSGSPAAGLPPSTSFPRVEISRQRDAKTMMSEFRASTSNLISQVTPYSKRRAAKHQVTWIKKIFGIGACQHTNSKSLHESLCDNKF